MAVTCIAAGVVECLGVTAEVVVRLITIPVLLVAEHVKCGTNYFEPCLVEYRAVACLLPICISKAQGIAQGVNLVLTLVQHLVHLRLVGLPLAILRLDVEGVGIRVDQYAGKLTTDDATDEMTQGLVLIHIAEIGPDLCCAVTQPHGLDVASNDECIVVAAFVAIPDSRVECVWEAVDEHPIELGIDGRQLLFEVEDLFLDGFAAEEALLRLRTQVLYGALYCHLLLLGGLGHRVICVAEGSHWCAHQQGK